MDKIPDTVPDDIDRIDHKKEIEQKLFKLALDTLEKGMRATYDPRDSAVSGKESEPDWPTRLDSAYLVFHSLGICRDFDRPDSYQHRNL